VCLFVVVWQSYHSLCLFVVWASECVCLLWYDRCWWLRSCTRSTSSLTWWLSTTLGLSLYLRIWQQEIRSVKLAVCPMQLFRIWSRDVHPVQNLLLSKKISWKYVWFFTEIWQYFDFQNGGRPPSWNCFTTIRDHPQSLCCWPQLPVKFHVNLIHRSEDIAILIFHIFGLKCLFRPPKWGFWGLWTPKCDYSSSKPPKGTSLHKSASFKLSTVKIRWEVWPVGKLTESVTDTQTHTHTGKFTFCPCIALERQQVELLRCLSPAESATSWNVELFLLLYNRTVTTMMCWS